MNYNFRKLVLIDALTILEAKESLIATKVVKNIEELTCIDTTADLNQNKWLGQELNNVLVFFSEDSKPNALLAIFSCIKSGSTIYLAYASSQICGYFKKNILLPRLKSIEYLLLTSNLLDSVCSENTDVESRFNETVENIISSDYNVIHLLGLRGVGKSTLLGIIANRYFGMGFTNIALISQYKTSSRKTFDILNDVSRETVRYFSPAEFNLAEKDCGIILVDEAASLPKQFIQRIENQVKLNNTKVVFATTIEGYEGTGQSYRLNYIKEKEHLIVTLKETLRFSQNDPIHRLCQTICCPVSSRYHLDDGDYVFNTIQLRENNLTEGCFTLLQNSHYRTTPNDLERFYNEPALFVLAIKSGEIISVLYALYEELPLEIYKNPKELLDIFYGRRRIKNALTQQSLINAYGVNSEIANAKIIRISRIATVYKYRRKGVASRLIQKLAVSCNDYDILSTSFTLTKSTLLFWESLKFQLVRVGLNKNKANDKYSVLMLYNLTNNQCLVNSYTDMYNQHLYYYKKMYDDINVFKIPLKKEHAFTQNKLPLSKLKIQVDSVIDGYRDIHWLLPILYPYFQKNKTKMQFLQPIMTGSDIKKSNLAQAKLLLKKIREFNI